MNETGARDDESRTASGDRLREDLAALRLPRDRSTGDVAVGAELDGSVRRAQRWRRIVWIVALGLALAVIAWRVFSSAPLPVEVAAAVPYAEAARVPIPVLSGSGYLVPAQPFIAVGSRIAGRIQRYRVDEGDGVRAGQALVELDPAPYRAVAEQLGAGRATARARSAHPARELARARKLSDTGVLSAGELERRESEAAVARAQVEEIQASLERARIDLSDTVIRAPTDGVVLETYKQPGEVAVPGGFAGSGDLLRLADLSEIRAELDVNEADLDRVVLGQPAEVTPDAYPEAVYAAAVVELAPQIDRQKGTRKVEVRVLHPDEKLLPDMAVRVVFLSSLAEGSGGQVAAQAVIPRGALRRDAEGRPFVWIVDRDRGRRVRVQLGESLGDRVVVREGLAGHERVILGAAPERDGDPVQVVEAESPPAADG
jgi:HlyD family secretion protein